jgi:hypothetical protein
MKVTRVCCQGCGADLQVDETIRFVTCNYCGAKLEVVHGASVTHTKQLDKIERTTDLLAANLKVIELQNEIERLDREWSLEREGLMVRGNNGHVSEPSSVGAIIGGMLAVVGGIVWIGFAASIGAPGFFPLFGLVFIGVAVAAMASSATKAGRFGNRKSLYDTRRAALLAQLEAERGR